MKALNRILASTLLCAGCAVPAYGEIQTAGTLLVNLEPAGLPAGPVSWVTNSGSVGGVFQATGLAAVDQPVIVNVGGGAQGLMFDGHNFMEHLSSAGGTKVPLPSALSGANAPCSIECWVNNPSTWSNDGETMVDWGVRGTGGYHMAFCYSANGDHGATEHWGYNMGWATVPAVGVWHHLVYTFDGTTQKIYADGVLQKSGSAVYNPIASQPINLAAQRNNDGSLVGGGGVRGSLTLGKVRIHSAPLTDAQVAANYNAEKAAFVTAPTPLAAKPIHRYTFNNATTNDAVGLTVPDVGTAPGADAVIQGVYGSGSASFSGGKIRLSGGTPDVSPYVDLPNRMISSLSSSNSGSGKLTVEGWLVVTGGRTWPRLFDFGNSSSGEMTGPGGSGEGASYFALMQVNTYRDWHQCEVNNRFGYNGAATNSNARGFGLANDNGLGLGMTHYAVTWDEASGEIVVYVNGVEATRFVTSHKFNQIDDVNVWLGRSNWLGDNNLQGDYDEFRVYDYVLSPPEVQNNYQGGPDVVGFTPRPSVLAGPFTNPANAHLYYLLNQSTWLEAEQAAVAFGGHLATIRNQSEQDWIYTTFSNLGEPRSLFFGLMDPDLLHNSTNVVERRAEFVWVSGEPITYSNWHSAEPNNGGTNSALWGEYYGMMFASDDSDRGGFWNDILDAPVGWGVAEVVPRPVILSGPVDQKAARGSDVLLSVQTSGGWPLHYQWLKDGNPIMGATSTSLSLTQVQPSAAGKYSIVVTNLSGSITGLVATLAVELPPAIVNQPLGQVTVVGNSLQLSVLATGNEPLSYQWSKDGLEIPGATLPVLKFGSVQLKDAGRYVVSVSSPFGTVTSSAAVLNVVPGTQLGLTPVPAQTARQTWTRQYLGGYDSVAGQTVLLRTNGMPLVVGVGYTNRGGIPAADLVAVQWDTAGNQLWEARFGQAGMGSSTKVSASLDPATGTLYLVGIAETNAWFAAYDSEGKALFGRAFPRGGLVSWRLAQGNIYALSSDGLGKYDALGREIWFVPASQYQSGVNWALSVDAAGDPMLLACNTAGQLFAVRFDENATYRDTQWPSLQSRTGISLNGSIQDNAGNLYIRGAYQNGGMSSMGGRFAAKVGIDGQIGWVLDEPLWGEHWGAYDFLSRDMSDRIYFAGSESTIFWTPAFHTVNWFFVKRYDPTSGIWIGSDYGSPDSLPVDVTGDPQGNQYVYAAGRLSKTDSLGYRLWEMTPSVAGTRIFPDGAAYIYVLSGGGGCLLLR